MKLLLWLILLSHMLSAAIPGILLFKKLTIENGLSENSGYAIFQDKKGFMWFGTEAGLNRYDGYNFVVFKPAEGKRDSLSNYFIYSICEDDDGYLWVGTDDGLNRYDSRLENFTRFLPDAADPNSISGSKIYCLFKDRKGFIWVGSDKGLNRYDKAGNRFERFMHDPQNLFSISHNHVRGIAQAPDGRFLIATMGGGLNILNYEKHEFTCLRNDGELPCAISSNDLTCVLFDRHGYAWIGSRDGGLIGFDINSLAFRIYRNSPIDPNSISNDSINALLCDQAGNLWVGTAEGGINLFDPVTGRFQSYRSRAQDPKALSNDQILSLYQDRTGMYWIGTYGSGLNKFRPQESNFVHYYARPNDPNALSVGDVRSFCVDRLGQLWVGTDTRGLDLYDRVNNRFRHFTSQAGNPSSLSNNRVFSIVEDLAGNLWVGTYAGLNRFIPQSGAFARHMHDGRKPDSLSDDRIRCISRSPDGLLWIGTDGGGLDCFNPQTGQAIHYRHNPQNPGSIGYDRIFGVYADSDNQTVWVSTFGRGLSVLDRRKGIFQRYEHDPDNPHSVSNNYLIPVIKSRDGMIYFGSNGGGLTRFNAANKEFNSFTESEGLPNNTVYGIVEDGEGMLWLSTNKGICRFNPRNGKTKNYDINDGLQSNEFNGGSFYRSQAGLVYFGGINGFNEFDPRLIQDNPHTPAIVITQFLVQNKPVPIGVQVRGSVLLTRSIVETKKIELTYRDNFISFDFAALSFVAPEKNQYAYMLEGFDNEWIHINNRHFVTFTGLPAGSYVLRIKGSNNDGVWNEAGLALPIVIAPPFWNTWWFRLFAALTIIALGYVWYASRISNLKRAKAELQRLVDLRTQELREATLTDPLTGLRNRRYVSEILISDVRAFVNFKKYLNASTERRQLPNPEMLVFGIFLFDIDHFKFINDTYGHEAGDRFLLHFALILKGLVRQDDVIVRHGGEEFMVILKKTNFEYLDAFARKALQAIADTAFAISPQVTIQRTSSIGYTSFPFFPMRPERLTLEQTIMLADLGLYHAKENGRNQATYVEEGENFPSETEDVREVISSLPHALKTKAICLTTINPGA